MRFLIAILLCCAIQTQAVDRFGLVAAANPKSNTKTVISVPSSKKLIHFEQAAAFSKEFIEQYSEVQRQNQYRINLNGDVLKISDNVDLKSTGEPIYSFKPLREFSYRSTFSYLYPKHAFW